MVNFIIFYFLFIFIWGSLVSIFPSTILKLMPDLLSMWLFLMVIVRNNFKNIINKNYIVLLLLFSFLGFLINAENINVYLSGIRNYFKFIPIFFASFVISENERYQLLNKFTKLFLFFAFLQIPISLSSDFIFTVGGEPGM
jgi:hypothetical protein